MPRALVIRAAGTNCDDEVCRGLSLAGAEPVLVHVDRLIAEPGLLDSADIAAFPGGFSYGDDIASGRIFAMKLRERVYPGLRAAAARGVPIIGICNGFQVLVQVGLLPGPPPGEPWPESVPPPQQLALCENKEGRYACRWVPVAYEPASVCVWTRGLERAAMHEATLPVGHGEGRLVARSPEVIAGLERHGQVVLRYGENYNGSEAAIAGVCDPSGRVFGLMPHPDRFLDWTRHPCWTRLSADQRSGPTPGLRMFRNAVEAAEAAPARG